MRLRFLAPPDLLDGAPHEIVRVLASKDIASEIAVGDAVSRGVPVLVNGAEMDRAAYSACASCDCGAAPPAPGR